MTATTTTKAPALNPGDTIRCPAGPAIVAVTRHERGHYLLTVEYASTGAQIDELRRTYTDEHEARRVARGLTKWFRHGLTVPQILDIVAAFSQGA